MILVVHAHPYPQRSHAGAAILREIGGLPGLEVRSLYDLYPDFDIDAAAEQDALRRAALVAWLHPIYWYSVPGLLKLWFDKVLVSGFAFGDGGDALAGKPCLWVPTTGGKDEDYRPGGRHDHPFRDFVPVVEMTARYCGMQWLEPLVVHDAEGGDEAALAARGRQLRERLAAYAEAPA